MEAFIKIIANWILSSLPLKEPVGWVAATLRMPCSARTRRNLSTLPHVSNSGEAQRASESTILHLQYCSGSSLVILF